MKRLINYTIYDKKGGPCLYFYLDLSPNPMFYFEWNEWNKTIKIFGVAFKLVKLPF